MVRQHGSRRQQGVNHRVARRKPDERHDEIGLVCVYIDNNIEQGGMALDPERHCADDIAGRAEVHIPAAAVVDVALVWLSGSPVTVLTKPKAFSGDRRNISIEE